MQTRVYLALDAVALRALQRSGSVGPTPLAAYAVTTDLRQAHPGTDEEGLEYLAFLDATAADPAGSRVVLAADVDADDVREVLDAARSSSAVEVLHPLALRQVASVHIREPGAPGTPDYSWYDATELDVVLDSLSSTR